MTPGGKLVAVLAGEDLHVHDDAELAVRHAQGGVAHLAGLVAEDGAQKALFRGQLGLALGGHLAHEDVVGAHFRADADDAALVEVAQRVLAHAGDVAGDLLRAELGVAGLGFVLLDVDGGVHVVLHQPLAEQHGVLVVVALPGHKADEHVAAQGDLALVGGGAVGDDLAAFDDLAFLDDGGAG